MKKLACVLLASLMFVGCSSNLGNSALNFKQVTPSEARALSILREGSVSLDSETPTSTSVSSVSISSVSATDEQDCMTWNLQNASKSLNLPDFDSDIHGLFGGASGSGFLTRSQMLGEDKKQLRFYADKGVGSIGNNQQNSPAEAMAFLAVQNGYCDNNLGHASFVKMKKYDNQNSHKIDMLLKLYGWPQTQALIISEDTNDYTLSFDPKNTPSSLMLGSLSNSCRLSLNTDSNSQNLVSISIDTCLAVINVVDYDAKITHSYHANLDNALFNLNSNEFEEVERPLKTQSNQTIGYLVVEINEEVMNFKIVDLDKQPFFSDN